MAEMRRTLKIIRENAPPQDRGLPALASLPSKPFVRHNIFATTLYELRDKCGPNGEAAVQEAQWSIIMAWLMRDVCGDSPALSSPYRVVLMSVMLVQDSDRVRLGYPLGSNGKPHDNRLPALSPECQAEARLVASETMADWERAGHPGITANRLKTIQQFISACTQAPIIQEIAA
ncbi:MAG: hypothetical protein IPP45_01925 [Sphingomonadales bacterium]|nr:hypothetical protein [Sphingomonadales bacterium]